MYRVIDGADDALSMMEKVPVNPKNRPLEPITLQKVCGVGSFTPCLFVPGHHPCEPFREVVSARATDGIALGEWPEHRKSALVSASAKRVVLGHCMQQGSRLYLT